MARIARIVIPGVPHHVTQRGNRRETVFFEDGDYLHYMELLSEAAQKSETEVWAYCLMPNHAHLILTPSHGDGLRATLGDAHRRYTRFINARNKWTGHLWQGRFGSAAMDEEHLAHGVRYVSLNPVRAKLVKRARDWRWSSVRAHLAGKDDPLVTVAPVLERCPDFTALLKGGEDEDMIQEIRKAETIGRPIGTSKWLEEIEQKLGRTVRPCKRGPQAKETGGEKSKLSP
ncbi:MAG TPA: transposase [Rhodospirillales bacterium]|nr:transposase [Rhodospirillales bacterium]